MTEKVKHHQYLTEKTREEQKQCRNRMSQLETERDQVFKEIQGAESDKIHQLCTDSEHDMKEFARNWKMSTNLRK